jgi:RNA polymerase sigma-54 factor
MRLDTSQHMRTEMRLRMAPRMIQSMEILQLAALALQERIDQELIENPLLVDLRDARVTPEPADAETAPATPAAESAEAEVDAAPFDGFEEWADSYGEMHRPSRAALSEQADRKLDAMQNMAGRPRSFHDQLVDQLSFFDVDPNERALAEYIIYNLDENGYLTLELAEVARDFGGSATLEQAESALRLVQKLDPPGVGARNLPECLLLQLTPDVPHHDVLRQLITLHIDDLQHNRLPQIEKKTGIPLDRIKDAIESLRRLDPRPGGHHDTDRSLYVVPDIAVEPNDAGGYDVRLLDEHTPQLSISRRYQKLLKNKEADPEARAYIQKKLQAARWLIESVEQRRATLLKVARAIVEHQHGFLDNGPEFLEPLKMQQIADKVGVHVTTVSRAVDDKWAQTPRGVFPLKRFFGGGTKTADGEDMAWDTIKQKLLEIIAKENKHNPMSDEEIVDELEKLGIPVARRTVSKYRKALKIPSSRQRKVF